MRKGIRVGILILIGGLFFCLVVFSITNEPPVSSKVWDEGTTIGDPETATRHYVQYADFGCPYCDVFSRLTVQNKEDFEKFLADNHILFEIRLTDTIYYSAGVDFSKDSAVAAFCAKREGKFIDYYHEGIMALYDDYQSKGIGDSKTSPMITGMADDYWLKVGHKIGLSDSFDDCVENQETLDEVSRNTEKASQYINGLPYFQFEDFKQSGFDNIWGYEYVVKYLEAGLK